MNLINFDEAIKLGDNGALEFIQNEPHLPRHPFRMIINGASGSGKTNLLFNMMFNPNFMLNYSKVYLYAKDLQEDKYVWLKKIFEELEAESGEELFTAEDSLDNVITTEELDRSRMNLIIFDDFVTEKNQSGVEELFKMARHANTSMIYLSQSYHLVPSFIRKNVTHVIFFKPTSKREIQTLVTDFASDCDKEDFKKLMVSATKEKHSFLFIDILAPNKSLKYRKGFTGLSNWNDE
jgi:hypothetical protein